MSVINIDKSAQGRRQEVQDMMRLYKWGWKKEESRANAREEKEGRLVKSGTSRIHVNRLSSSAPSRLSFARSKALGAAKRRHRRSWETCASTRVEGRGIESGVPALGTEPCDDRSAGRQQREGGLFESSVNSVASSAGAEVVPSDVRSVTGVGMEGRRSRRKRKARVVVMVVVASADAGRQRVVEDQLEPCL